MAEETPESTEALAQKGGIMGKLPMVGGIIAGLAYHGPAEGDDHVGSMIGEGAVFAIQDVAIRLDEELSAVESRTASRAAERRMIQ